MANFENDIITAQIRFLLSCKKQHAKACKNGFLHQAQFLKSKKLIIANLWCKFFYVWCWHTFQWTETKHNRSNGKQSFCLCYVKSGMPNHWKCDESIVYSMTLFFFFPSFLSCLPLIFVHLLFLSKKDNQKLPHFYPH